MIAILATRKDETLTLAAAIMRNLISEDHFFENLETSTELDYVLRAGEGVPEEGLEIKPHMHLEHEIMWFHKAQGSYSIGSEKFAIKDNTLIYISPLVLHDMALEFTCDHERFLFQYDRAVLNRLKYPIPTMNPHIGIITQPNELEAERLQFLFKWLAQVHETGHSTDDTNPVMILLLNTVFQCASRAQPISPEKDNLSLFEKIITFMGEMEKRTSLNISLNEAAAAVGLSSCHFSRTFKKIMQISFKEYLLRKKIARSVDMLRNTALSITDIAYQCEFTDAAYYCFQFKKLIGVTPKKFRNHSLTSVQLHKDR